MKLVVNTVLLAVIFHACKGRAFGVTDESNGEGWPEMRPRRNLPSKRFMNPSYLNYDDISPVAGCNIFRLDDDETESLTNLHNHLRRKVAKGQEWQGYRGRGLPMAANMQRMGYDAELEYYSLKFSEKCDPFHQQPVQLEGFHSVWQLTLYDTDDDYLDPYNMTESILEHYIREVVKFNGDDAIAPFFGANSLTNEDVVAFAILINHDTKSLGCSQATSYDTKRRKYVRMASCYYGNGLVNGMPLYRFGEPCSDVHRRDCDDGLVIQDSGLSSPSAVVMSSMLMPQYPPPATGHFKKMASLIRLKNN